MKKFILASLIATVCFLYAQSSAMAQEMTPTGGQTVISTGSKSFVVAPSLNYKTATFQVVATRVSAAQGGTWLIYGSNDGTNYMQLTESTHPAVTNDTLTVANAATSSTFTGILPVEGISFKYYKITVTGASSDTMTVKAWFNGRQ